MDILEYLQSTGKDGSSHTFDFIIAIAELDAARKALLPQPIDPEVQVIIGNKDIFAWIKSHGGTISSITLQRRKTEAIDMGLAIKYHRKRGSGDDIIITKKCIRVAQVIKKFTEEIAVAFADQQTPAPTQPIEAPPAPVIEAPPEPASQPEPVQEQIPIIEAPAETPVEVPAEPQTEEPVPAVAATEPQPVPEAPAETEIVPVTSTTLANSANP
ncbi:Uncharacterised protein [uncultured archaeon]|nr:Uncharacterised protein [uncultured archaeon]